MKIVFDLSALPYGTGVSRYSTNLFLALLETRQSHQIIPFASSLRRSGHIRHFLKSNHISGSCLIPFPPSLISFLFQRLRFPAEIITGKFDIFHSWDWYLPYSRHGNVITTVHDLALFRYPSSAHRIIRSHHLHVITRAKSTGAHVITVSQSTKQDLIQLFRFPDNKIHVIPEALPKELEFMLTHKQVQATLNQHHITKPYLLVVGTQEPRKNIPLMIQAWRHFAHDFDLVIAGHSGWDRLPKHTGIHLLGYLPSYQLACLYRGASLLLYASLYEGFGLPILEAFYHRLPVVTSNISSMPEVAGNAAALVDPLSQDSIQTGIAQALNRRQELIELGIKRLEEFSWNRTALATINAYQRAYQERK